MTAQRDVILLHGALGASSQLEPLAEALRADFRVHLLDFAGHGSAPSRSGKLAIGELEDDLLTMYEADNIERAGIFGFSMGGYVALHFASRHPGRVDRIATLGTKFRWDPGTAEREAARLDPDAIAAKVPKFAETLRARHERAGGWKAVLARTAAFLHALGDDPPLTDAVLRTIALPVKVMVGDRDSTVDAGEAAAVAALLPGGTVMVLEGVPHPIEQVSASTLAGELREFFGAAR